MHAEPKSFQVFLGIFYCHVGLAKGTGVDFVGFSDRLFHQGLASAAAVAGGLGAGKLKGGARLGSLAPQVAVLL